MLTIDRRAAKIKRKPTIIVSIFVILAVVIFLGCKSKPALGSAINMLVWAEAPRVQNVATPGKINLSLTNQDKRTIPEVRLRSEKLEDFVVNSVKPKPIESDEGTWTFGKVASGKSLNVVLNVTPKEPGLHKINFTFESPGWTLIRPDGSPATFEIEISVGRIVDWKD